MLKYTKYIPSFRGIFMRDTLPRMIRKNESGIINLDSNVGSGTHWTAYSKRGSHITYFDSVGQLKPPPELVKYFHSDGSRKDIRYNFTRYQKLNTYNCGHLVLTFLNRHAL